MRPDRLRLLPVQRRDRTSPVPRKSATGARQQQHAHGAVGLHLGERVAYLLMHRIGETVEAIGTVERQPRDAVGMVNRMFL